MKSMEKRIRWPATPYYGAAAVWAVWAAFFDLYKTEHFVTVSILSMAAFWLLRTLMQGKAVEEEVPLVSEVAEKPTGNAALDNLLREGRAAVQEMRRLSRSIQDPEVSIDIARTETAALNIFNHIRSNPQKAPQIRRFMDYYLPTTLKLLNAYKQMNETGISGKNINATKARIADMMKLITAAFEAQLDSLFGNEALDISADTKVLTVMLRQEGLLDSAPELQISQHDGADTQLK